MNSYPTTSIWDLFRLIGSMLGALLRGPRRFDAAAVLTGWMRSIIQRHESPNVILNFLFARILLVSGRDLSDHVLQAPPDNQHYVAGTLKSRVMTLLAPKALTISHGRNWQGLRTYNVDVLTIDENSGRRQALIDRVGRAFAAPVGDIDQIRLAMGHLMLSVVVGEKDASPALLADFQILYDNMNMRNVFLGRDDAERRQRFYAELARLWRQSTEESDGSAPLLSCGRAAQRLVSDYDFDEEIFLNQIPHWMFTFIGSGTDLLARTLALITSRPAIHARALSEVEAAGPLDRPTSVDSLAFVEACLREAGRLFPPVMQTLHSAPEGDTFDGVSIAPESELLQFFPLTNRDVTSDPGANNFVPERWLDDDQSAAAAYPNLLLSGARACPGEDIIVLVCKSAIAILLAKHNLKPVGPPALGADPLPFSFPASEFGLKY